MKSTEKYLKKQSTWFGIAFVSVFVIQQFVAFVWRPFNLVTPYWILYLLVFGVLVVRNWYRIKQDRNAFLLFAVSAFCSILTVFNGDSIGVCIVKAICPLIGLTGLYYLTSHKINLIVFDILFPLLYLYFFYSYFVIDIASRSYYDENLFGHSSSNTIPIVLNVVWLLYYIIAKSYGRNIRKNMLLIFSLVNVFLIIIQGSRIGVVVAAINCILALADVIKLKYMFIPVLIGIGGYLFMTRGGFLEGIIEYEHMQGIESYKEDVRSLAQRAFFSNLSLESFLFGYPEYVYFASVDRTFNAFLDFWRQYGILPVVLLAYFIYIRIRKYKNYKVPIIAFVPLFIYSFFETIWGNTLWDILIYIMLFYSNEKTFTFNEDMAK